MSDTTSTQAPADNAEPTATQQQGDPADAPLGEKGKKALDAERARAEAAEKREKALAAKLSEIEKAQLSDLERAQRERDEAMTRLSEIEAANMRQRVALAKGLPADLVDRLRGSNEDELSADADALLALVKAPTSPKPDLSQAGSGAPMPLNGDPLEQALRSKLGM